MNLPISLQGKELFNFYPLLKIMLGFGALSIAQYFLVLKNIIKYNKNKKKRLNEIFYKFLHQQEQVLVDECTVTNIPILLKRYSCAFEQLKLFEQIIPRQLEKQTDLSIMSKCLHQAKDNQDLGTLQKCLIDPVYDLLDRGGKRIRPALVLIISQVFEEEFEKLQDIAVIAELLHNASLIIDDIEDDSQQRRGKDCIHKIYNTDVALNAANFAYFQPIQLIMNSKKYSNKFKMQLIQIYIDEMVHIHMGQGWDIQWHQKDNIVIPTEDQYLQMVAHKTGVMFRMIAKMCMVIIDQDYGTVREKLWKYCEALGIGFQIQDDILNLVGQDYDSKGEDIYEGKMSLMVIHCLNNSQAQDKNRLMQILKMKTQDQTLIKEAISIIQKSKSIEYANIRSKQIINNAWNEVNYQMPQNKGKKLLFTLGQFCYTREF